MDQIKKNLQRQIKSTIHEADPGKAVHSELMQQTDVLEAIDEKLSKPLKFEDSEETKKEKQRVETVASFIEGFLTSIKGEKGDPSTVPGPKGDKGDRGPKGDKGDNGDDGLDGEDGEDGYTPVKGVDYFDGKDGKDGRDGKDGKDGADGKDVTPEQVVAYIKKNRTLDISHIKNGESLARAATKLGSIDFNDQRWHGGGMSSSKFISGEVVDGSGTSWTLAHTPRLFLGLYARGQRLSTARNDYTISGRDITTSDPWNAGDIEADYYPN